MSETINTTEIDGQQELFEVEQPKLTVTQVLDDVLETFEGDLTMYKVAVVLNTVLEILEVTKDGNPYQVRPQMIYNYNRNKMVVKGVVLDRKATKEETATFITRFVGRLTK